MKVSVEASVAVEGKEVEARWEPVEGMGRTKNT